MKQRKVFTVMGWLIVSAIVLAVLMPLLSSHAASTRGYRSPNSTTGDWPTYLYTELHNGNNSNETILNASNVASLKLKWKFATHGTIAPEPVVVNGAVYVGSGGGSMYSVNASTGTMNWKTSLGVYTSSTCTGYHVGITGTATVSNGVVYIGAGPYFFALDAQGGNILWQRRLGTSGTTNDVIYSGSAVANGKTYVGISSMCDNPLTQGMLYALNTSNGSIAALAPIVPKGKVGGGIWSVPTIDAATGTVIVTTGSVEKSPPIQPMTASIVTLDWNTLAVKQYWQVPGAQRVADADWGCAPALFPGLSGSGKTYVGCINKDSIYFVFDEANVAAGPIWQQKLGPGGNRGGITGSFASAAYVNGTLYIPTALATVNGTSYAGSIGAFNALTGQQLWRFGTAGSVPASVITANGLLFDGEGSTFEVRDQSTGKVLFSYPIPTGGKIWGSATVSNGVVYIPSYDHNLYALAPS
jgi:outer membrane protein assembly factor BamB